MEANRPDLASRRDPDALWRASRIYVATVRNNGDQSKAVPVWFTQAPDQSMLIQTGRGSWIAKRVRHGSRIIVWIGRRNGPALIGNAEISNDPKLTTRIVDDYPRKYLLARIGFHRPRQARFDAGQVLAIKITPTRNLPEGFTSEPGSPAPGIRIKESPRERPTTFRRSVAGGQVANLLSASRFVLAALWLMASISGNRRPEILGSIALAAAASDFADGRIARWMDSAGGIGRWLDALADIVFVLTALTSEAVAGIIPIYIPVLIACSFAQYAIDSIAISGSSSPVRSRLGHWGGVINFALVLALAWAPLPLLSKRLVTRISRLLAIFYIAAMCERALNYRQLGSIRRDSRAGPCSF